MILSNFLAAVLINTSYRLRLWLTVGVVVWSFIVVSAYAEVDPGAKKTSENTSLTPSSLWPDPLNDKQKRQHADTIIWKFAHPAPPASHLPPVWRSGFSWLHKATFNGLQIKEYGGGVLYGFNGGFKAIRAGIAEFGTCYSAAESRGLELLRTFHAPYVAPANPYLTARIINELTAARIKTEFQRKGVYPGHVVPVRPLTLMSKTPIRSPADLKGKKIVSFVNTPGADQALGFAQVRVPFTEIYTALQQELVDAVIWVDMGFIPFKIYEQAKFYTDLNIAPITVDTCINQKAFDRLPGPLKKNLYDFQQRMGIALVSETANFARGAQQILEAHGVTVIRLTDQERQQWRKAFEPVVEQWLRHCDKQGKDCRGLVKEIKELSARYGKLSDGELIELAIKRPVQGMIDF